MNKWFFLLVIIFVTGAVVTIAVKPISNAMASRVQKQTEVSVQEQAVLSGIRQAEQQATSQARVNARIAFWTGLTVATITAVVAVGFRAGSEVVTSVKTARLPVTRQIAPGAYVALLPPDNKPWLIDAYSGRRALLSEASDVDEVRAQIMSRSLTVDRLAQAAETIASHTGEASPADWLPYIGNQNQLEV